MTKTAIELFTEKMEKDDCYWESLASYIQSGYFDFCGCLAPEENLVYIMKGLQHISERLDKNIDSKKWMETGNELFGNENAKHFFYYWADKNNLTEHGFTLPGWLTPEGIQLLELLKHLQKEGEI